jgi:hypothetical protein
MDANEAPNGWLRYVFRLQPRVWQPEEMSAVGEKVSENILPLLRRRLPPVAGHPSDATSGPPSRGREAKQVGMTLALKTDHEA